jgi:hypothetical protein
MLSRRLSVVVLLLLFGANSISAISPHIEGEGGCPMACCKAAHGSGARSVLPKLCCKVDCKLPAGTQTSNAFTQFSFAARSLPPIPNSNDSLRLAVYLDHARFPYSVTGIAGGPLRTFLKNGALLI